MNKYTPAQFLFSFLVIDYGTASLAPHPLSLSQVAIISTYKTIGMDEGFKGNQYIRDYNLGVRHPTLDIMLFISIAAYVSVLVCMYNT